MSALKDRFPLAAVLQLADLPRSTFYYQLQAQAKPDKHAALKQLIQRAAQGTGVLGGMISATILVVLFAPLFYVVIEKTFGKRAPSSSQPQPDGDR